MCKLAVNNLPRSGGPDTLMEHYGVGVALIVATVQDIIGIAGVILP
jgi:hypothetical protein